MEMLMVFQDKHGVDTRSPRWESVTQPEGKQSFICFTGREVLGFQQPQLMSQQHLGVLMSADASTLCRNLPAKYFHTYGHTPSYS